MDNYFTSFRLLTHLGVINIGATVCSTKTGYANALSRAYFSHLMRAILTRNALFEK